MEKMFDQCTAMMRTMGSNMMGNNMMGGMMSNMMGGMMWPMLLGLLLLAALVVVGSILLIHLLRSRPVSAKSGALSILQERFARGEIDLEEYQERMSVLQYHG
jgi:putative membrane protein